MPAIPLSELVPGRRYVFYYPDSPHSVVNPVGYQLMGFVTASYAPGIRVPRFGTSTFSEYHYPSPPGRPPIRREYYAVGDPDIPNAAAASAAASAAALAAVATVPAASAVPAVPAGAVARPRANSDPKPVVGVDPVPPVSLDPGPPRRRKRSRRPRRQSRRSKQSRQSRQSRRFH